MSNAKSITLLAGVAFVSVGGFATDLYGSLSISPNFITIKATAGSSSVTWSVPVTDDPMDSIDPVDPLVSLPVGNKVLTGWEWNSFSPFSITDGGTTLLTVTELGLLSALTVDSVSNEHRWGHEFGFALVAGDLDVDIEITTNVLSFSTVADAFGISDTAFTLLHSAGSAPGAQALGLLPSGHAFNASYNGGVTFRDYLDFDPALIAVTTASAEGNMVPPGSLELVGDVSSLFATYKFRLSADDQASATGKWGILPAPGSFGLLAAGLLVAGRRNRKS